MLDRARRKGKKRVKRPNYTDRQEEEEQQETSSQHSGGSDPQDTQEVTQAEEASPEPEPGTTARTVVSRFYNPLF